MIVVVDRKGRVVACFVHFSDSVQFVASSPCLHYAAQDEPGLDRQIAEWIATARITDAPQKNG